MLFLRWLMCMHKILKQAVHRYLLPPRGQVIAPRPPVVSGLGTCVPTDDPLGSHMSAHRPLGGLVPVYGPPVVRCEHIYVLGHGPLGGQVLAHRPLGGQVWAPLKLSCVHFSLCLQRESMNSDC